MKKNVLRSLFLFVIILIGWVSVSFAASTGQVIVKYVDANGTEISEQTEIFGNIGEEYKVFRKEISGYVSNGSEPLNKVGNYQALPVEVIFEYVDAINAVEITNKNNQITVTVKNEPEIKEYIIKIITQDSETKRVLPGAVYSVEKDNVIIKEDSTIGDALVVGSIKVSGEGLDSFVINEKAAPKGFDKILQENIQFQINKTLNATTNEYEINLVYNAIKGVTINKNNNEIVVIIENDRSTEIKESTKEKIEEENIVDVVEEEKVEETVTETVKENTKTSDEIVFIVIIFGLLIAANLVITKRK